MNGGRRPDDDRDVRKPSAPSRARNPFSEEVLAGPRSRPRDDNNGRPSSRSNGHFGKRAYDDDSAPRGRRQYDSYMDQYDRRQQPHTGRETVRHNDGRDAERDQERERERRGFGAGAGARQRYEQDDDRQPPKREERPYPRGHRRQDSEDIDDKDDKDNDTDRGGRRRPSRKRKSPSRSRSRIRSPSRQSITPPPQRPNRKDNDRDNRDDKEAARSTSKDNNRSRARRRSMWDATPNEVPKDEEGSSSKFSFRSIMGSGPLPGGGEDGTPSAVQGLAMQNHQARQARRLYVGNIPQVVTDAELKVFFETALQELQHENDRREGRMRWREKGRGKEEEDTEKVVAVQVSLEKRYAFCEFRSAEDANVAIGLDGIYFSGQQLRIRRPRDYIPNTRDILSGTAAGSSFQPAAAAQLGVVSNDQAGLATDYKIYLGNIPRDLTEEQVQQFVGTFGRLKYFNLVRDKGQPLSKGYAFFEYVTPSDAHVAIAGLNGLDLVGRELRCKFANGPPASSVPTPINPQAAAAAAASTPPVLPPSLLAPSLDASSPDFPSLSRQHKAAAAAGGGGGGIGDLSVTDIEAIISASKAREAKEAKEVKIPGVGVVGAGGQPTKEAAAKSGGGGGVAKNAMLMYQITATTKMGMRPSRVVQLLNMVSTQDLQNDLTYQEIFHDVLNEVSQFGSCVNIVIPRPELGKTKGGVGKIFIHFSDVAAAKVCRQSLAGRTFQNRTVVASFYSEEDFNVGNYK